MTTDHLAGAAVVVVQDGQVVLEKGYGLARLRPAAPMDVQTTRFRLGGLSEVFTWLEVLKLVEAGRLDLDAPIDDVLPDRLKLGLEGFQKPVRLRHLMTHTAGFEARELGRLFKDDPRRLLGLETALRKQRSRRVREAGALASYSVYGAALAGAAAANVAGKPFDQLIESDLLAPAGLDATRFREPYPAESALPAPLPESAAQHFSDGFRWGGDGLDPQPFAYGQDFAPGLSASSTGRDMGRLMQLLLGAPAPWGPGVAAAPFTPMQSSGPGLPGWTYGLQQQPLAGGFAGFGHAGAAMSFRSRMLLAPQLRLGVFVVSNTDSGQTLVDRLPAAVIARFYAPPPSTAALGSPQPAIEAHRYAGLYLTTRRAYHGLEGLTARLTRATRVSVGPDGRLSVRSSGSTRQFTPAGPDRFVSLDGAQTLAFSAPPEHADAPARLMLDPAQAEAVVRESALHAPGLLVVGAGAAGLTALLCFAGAALRLQRDERATRGQTVANAVQMVAAACWLLAIGAGLVFLRQARDPEALMYQWPNLWLVSASCLALAATILGVAQIVQLRAVWERASRHHAWNTGRRLRHTLSVGVFAAFSALLATWGALFPWTS
jgi:CubicO group peptidase (beta-lactamase class C family)